MTRSRALLFQAATLGVGCLYATAFYGCLPTYTFGQAPAVDASGDATATGDSSVGPDTSIDAAADVTPEASVDATVDAPTDAPSDAPTDAPPDAPRADGSIPTTVVTAGSKQFATGYGYQLHLVYAENDRRYWFFYVDDTPGVIKTVASPDLVTWTPENPIALATGYSLTDGNNFSVAYANLASTDVIHIVADSTTASGDTMAFHIRAAIGSGAITALTPVAHPDSQNAASACPQDGPATIIATDGRVYDVIAWTSHGGTACDTNIYLSPGVETGTSFPSGAFTHDGYFVSVPSYAFAHDLVDLPEAGVVLATWPDEDNSDTYQFDSIGWALSPAFDGGAPGTVGDFPDAAAELFFNTGATASYNDWSLCRVTDRNIHLVRHLTSTTNTVSGFQEVVYDGTSWQPSSIPPGSVSSTSNTGVVLLSDGNPAHGLLAVTVASDSTLVISRSTTVGTWSEAATIAPSSGGAPRQSLGGSGCGKAPAVLFWTEGVPDAGTPFVVKRADLTSLLGP